MTSQPNQDRERLEQELLELHFGCHENPAALEAKLRDDPQLQDIYREIQHQASILVSAARDPLPELDLPLNQAKPNLKAIRMRPRVIRIAIAAAAVFILYTPFYLSWFWNQEARDAIADTLVQVSLTSDQATPDGAPIAFTVITTNYDHKTVACTIDWRALDAKGKTIATGETETSETDDKPSTGVALPANLNGVRTLEVIANTDFGPKKVTLDLRPTLARPLLHLTTSKPIYRPGEPVRIRAVALDRLDLTPMSLQGYPQVTIIDPRDSTTTTLGTNNLGKGTYSGEWLIPEQIAEGHYKLQFGLPNKEQVYAEQSIIIRRFQAPRLAKQIDLDRTTYATGSQGTAEVNVTRLAGGVAAGAKIKATLIVDGEPCWSEESQLSSTGSARFRFDIPSAVSRGAARFVARITDGGTIETIVEPFIIPTEEIAATIFPEGGDLVTGLTSQVYVEVRDLLGRPISATGNIVDQDGTLIAPFETEHQGRGRFALTPKKNTRYTLAIDSPRALSVDLPEAILQGVVLHADPKPSQGILDLTLQNNVDDKFTVAAFCRGALVGQSQITGRGTHTIALPIAKAQGVLRVTVFDKTMRARAERLVRVHQDRKVDLALVTTSKNLAPGDEQELMITARDEHGKPIADCVVGLSVTDAAVWARTDKPHIGLADTLDMFGDVQPLDDLSAYLPASEDSARNADLLLATQAWRRFAWQAEDSQKSATLATAASLDGYNNNSIATSSSTGTTEALRDADRARWASSRNWKKAAGILTLLGILFLAVEGFLFVGRLIHMRTQWREGPILGGLAGLGIACMTAVMIIAPGSFQGKWTVGEDIMSAFRPAGVLEEFFYESEDADIVLGYIKDFDVQVTQAAFAAPSVFDVLFDEEIEAGRPTEVPPEEAPEFNQDRVLNVAPSATIASEPSIAPPRELAYDGLPGTAKDPENVYWHPILITDEHGKAQAKFHVSDRITTWVAHADAYGKGRVGQVQLSFDAKLPFFLEAKLPTEVTEGDELLIPIALVSETTDNTAQVQIRTSGGAELRSAQAVELSLDQGRGRVLASVTITASDEPTMIHVQGEVGKHRHRQSSSIRVVPSGFPHHRSWAGMTKPGGTSFTLALPVDQKPRNARATLKLFPSPLASLRQSLEGIVQEPHGCFEQASSSNYPNLLVLEYLETSGDSIPALANRARNMLPKGYELITSYECKSHGYEWFGSDPGHETLTAYGLLQFTDMQRVAEVDQTMINTTRDWLLARRDGRGGFGNSHSGLDTFGGSPVVVNNAYITYSLLYSGIKPETLKPELDSLEARMTTTEDPYELALIASALREGGRSDEAAQARRQLAARQEADGSVRGTTTSITSSGGDNLIVESTSFAILAWLGDEAYTARVLQAIRYLQTKQSTQGTFGATQATIMALKALTAFAGSRSAIPEAGTVHISIDGDVVVSKRYDKDVSGAITIDLTRFLAAGQQDVTIELQGTDKNLPWACDLNYFADMPADDEGALIHITTSLSQTKIAEGDTVAVTAVIENTSTKGQAMTMAVIGLPAGLEVPTKVMEDLKKAEQFAFWELRGREVILYWRDMAPGSKRTITIDAIARIPGTTTGPASRTYLYYNPDRVHWAQPLHLTIH